MADILDFRRPEPKKAPDAGEPVEVSGLDPAIKGVKPVYIVFVPGPSRAWMGRFFTTEVDAATEVSTATWRSWEELKRDGWRIVPSIIMPLNGPQSGGRTA